MLHAQTPCTFLSEKDARRTAPGELLTGEHRPGHSALPSIPTATREGELSRVPAPSAHRPAARFLGLGARPWGNGPSQKSGGFLRAAALCSRAAPSGSPGLGCRDTLTSAGAGHAPQALKEIAACTETHSPATRQGEKVHQP